MSVVIFAGPSVHGLDIRSTSELIVKPPAMQGDIFRACLSHPRAIGIIDGYFDGVPSVWHKEILWALSQGIAVFGSASMGALRAAELDAFGMVGVGRIYQWYRDGILEDDDEVALIHGPGETGYLPLSEPMVNVRATCKAAVSEGVLQKTTAVMIIAVAKHIHYQDRTWDGLLAAVSAESAAEGELTAFSRWKSHGLVDQKKCDAASLITAILNVTGQPTRLCEVGFQFEWTNLWDTAVQEWATGYASADTASVINDLRLNPSEYREVSSLALVRSILLAEADRQRLVIDRTAKLAALGRLRKELGLSRQSDLVAWAKNNLLDEEGLNILVGEEASVDQVSQAVRASIDRHIISVLQSRGQYAERVMRARDKRRTLQALGAENPADALVSPPPPVVLNWFFGSRLQQAAPADIESFWKSLGLSSRQDFYRLLSDEYIYSFQNNNAGGGTN
jgi:hypothetical protein